MTDNFMYTLKELHRMDCDRKLLERETERQRDIDRRADRETGYFD